MGHAVTPACITDYLRRHADENNIDPRVIPNFPMAECHKINMALLEGHGNKKDIFR